MSRHPLDNRSVHSSNAAKVSLELKDFFNVPHELSVAQGYDVLLRGCRIIIPYVLRHKAIQLAHEGHQGVVKTKVLSVPNLVPWD